MSYVTDEVFTRLKTDEIPHQPAKDKERQEAILIPDCSSASGLCLYRLGL